MVEIPRDRFDGDEPGTGIGYEAVLFRHADPNVIAAMLPILTIAQRARFFGNARATILDADNFGGLQRPEASDDQDIAGRGMLRLSSDQYERFTIARITLVKRHVAEFLHRNAPDQRVEALMKQTLSWLKKRA